jgi:glucose-6-phosphate isomerase, archaeal
MAMLSGPVPVIDAVTGVLAGPAAHYRKTLRDLEGVFSDEQAFASRLAATPDEVVYEVYEVQHGQEAGDLIFGTSILEPGTVGSEFHMTRGHVHTVVDRVEMYYCLRGTGVLLLESLEGTIDTIDLCPGAVAYVPPACIHRSVNTGDERLITLFCYPADAGHDYEIVRAANGMRSLVVRAPDDGWALADNPRYRQRDA